MKAHRVDCEASMSDLRRLVGSPVKVASLPCELWRVPGFWTELPGERRRIAAIHREHASCRCLCGCQVHERICDILGEHFTRQQIGSEVVIDREPACLRP